VKYKLKIVPQDGGYVGYALLNDEVVFATSVYKDSTIVSRELSKFTNKSEKSSPIVPVPNKRANSAITIPTAINRSSGKPTGGSSRCCGRG
jgi:hypothetical protein